VVVRGERADRSLRSWGGQRGKEKKDRRQQRLGTEGSAPIAPGTPIDVRILARDGCVLAGGLKKKSLGITRKIGEGNRKKREGHKLEVNSQPIAGDGTDTRKGRGVGWKPKPGIENKAGSQGKSLFAGIC